MIPILLLPKRIYRTHKARHVLTNLMGDGYDFYKKTQVDADRPLYFGDIVDSDGGGRNPYWTV